MSDDDPVTEWINELRDADDEAAANLWNHFVARLCVSARGRLQPGTRRVYDEEDAALSAFWSVCSAVASGRFPDLSDRDSLWRLLLVITARKITSRHRYDHQQRRDINRNVEELFFQESGSIAINGVDHQAAREPTPEFAAELRETYDALYECLEEDDLREVVALRMEGYNDTEIAKRLDCSRRTVLRRIEIIRRNWIRLERSIE